MLSLKINSIQFANLNISDFSRKRLLLNSNAFQFMYNTYLTICVQLHSKLNSYSASHLSDTPVVGKLRKIPLRRSVALL